MSAMEIWQCKDCGNEFAVHCNYLPDLSQMQLHDLFVGTVVVEPGAQSLKALIKLKKALAFAERFEPAKLETQQKAGSLTWNIGQFLDFEVTRATEECKRVGVHAYFERFPG
nr:hypothetical protein [uncultured Rhodoferax sp.]